MSNDKYVGIFNAGVADGKSRDAIVVEMVQAGASLNTAQILYKDLAKNAGLVTSRVGHKKEALEFLGESQPDLTDEDTRAAVRAELSKKFEVAASTANDYIKAYAEQEGIELPRSSFGANPAEQEEIYSFIKANPNCSKEEFTSFMKDELGRSSGSIDETYRGLKLARRLIADGVTF